MATVTACLGREQRGSEQVRTQKKLKKPRLSIPFPCSSTAPQPSKFIFLCISQAEQGMGMRMSLC